jgi:hypothetical protein
MSGTLSRIIISACPHHIVQCGKRSHSDVAAIAVSTKAQPCNKKEEKKRAVLQNNVKKKSKSERVLEWLKGAQTR